MFLIEYNMVRFLLSVCLFLCALAQVLAENKTLEQEYYPRKNGILILDEHNFLAALYKYKFVFTFYYGDDKESKDAVPEFAKIYQALKDKESVIQLGEVNAIRDTGVMKKFPVMGTPLFRLFKNGRNFEYSGPVKSEHILTWLDVAMSVPLQINLASELEELVDKTCVILGCFPGKSPAASFQNLYNVSQNFVYDTHMPIPRFAVITSAKLAREMGVPIGSISIYKKFEGGAKSIYQGDPANFTSLFKFVNEETTPIVFKQHILEYDSKLSDNIITYEHLLFMRSDDKAYPEAFKNFKEAAKKYRNQTEGKEIVFVHVDLKVKGQENDISYFHIDINKDIPCNRITKIDDYHSRFVPSKRDFSYKGFIEFTENCISGKQQRTIRSDDQPSDWDAYDVKVLVGKTYSKFIADRSKTLFMLYYVPGQEKSEKAIPVFNELAKDMKTNKTITFGKMNVQTNDGEIDVHIKVPTIKMFMRNGKKIRYNGPVDKDAMEAFIQSAGATQVEREPEHGRMEYDFKWHTDNHPIDTVEDEERRKRKWEEEERKILKNAIDEQVAKEPHTEEKFKVKHPLRHLPLEERDPKHMDPEKHTDFEHMHEHELEKEHHGDEL